MKVFIFTYDRWDTITTSMLLKDIEDALVVCHNNSDKYVTANRLRHTIVETFQPRGLAFNRNFVLEHFMKEGEWAWFINDDLQNITMYSDYTVEGEKIPITIENQKQYKVKMDAEIDPDDFYMNCRQLTNQVDANTHLIGFSRFDNVLFRAKRWMKNVVIDGRSFLIRKTHLRYDTNVQCLEDICFTTLNLKAGFNVMENRWISVNCDRLTKGGFGTKKERIEPLKKEVEYLIKTYPDYIAVKEKKDWPPGTNVDLINRNSAIPTPQFYKNLFE